MPAFAVVPGIHRDTLGPEPCLPPPLRVVERAGIERCCHESGVNGKRCCQDKMRAQRLIAAGKLHDRDCHCLDLVLLQRGLHIRVLRVSVVVPHHPLCQPFPVGHYELAAAALRRLGLIETPVLGGWNKHVKPLTNTGGRVNLPTVFISQPVSHPDRAVVQRDFLAVDAAVVRVQVVVRVIARQQGNGQARPPRIGMVRCVQEGAHGRAVHGISQLHALSDEACVRHNGVWLKDRGLLRRRAYALEFGWHVAQPVLGALGAFGCAA